MIAVEWKSGNRKKLVLSKRRVPMNRVGLVCLCGVVGVAGAQPLEFVIDPARSSIDLTITLDLGALGGDSDSDSSSLSGTIDLAVDDSLSPADSSFHDLLAIMDSDLNYNWVPAFLSTADATLAGGYLEYAQPGVVIGPVPVVGGEFVFPAVPMIVGGILSVNYNIFLVGSGSEVIDLSTLDPAAEDFAGTMVVGDGTVTVSNSVPIEGLQPLIVDGSELGQVIFTGSATMVAVAQIPECLADMNGDGLLNFFDVSDFLTAYGNQDPAADFEPDGLYNFLDVSAFLTAYGAGCP